MFRQVIGIYRPDISGSNLDLIPSVRPSDRSSDRPSVSESKQILIRPAYNRSIHAYNLSKHAYNLSNIDQTLKIMQSYDPNDPKTHFLKNKKKVPQIFLGGPGGKAPRQERNVV